MVQQVWQRIEQTVPGVHFNWNFWSRNTTIRSTYPACRAVLAAKRQRAAAEPEMIRAINDRLNLAHCGRLFEPKTAHQTG